MHIIGVAGRKYHGKDSVARELVTLGYKVVRFAGPLKAMLRAFYAEHGIAPAEIERKIEGDLKEAPCPLLCGKTPRHAMQTLGEEWGRQLISSNLWVESLSYRAEASGAQKVVVPDVRYDNEAYIIEGLGGEVWRVVADEAVRRPHRAADGGEARHRGRHPRRQEGGEVRGLRHQGAQRRAENAEEGIGRGDQSHRDRRDLLPRARHDLISGIAEPGDFWSGSVVARLSER